MKPLLPLALLLALAPSLHAQAVLDVLPQDAAAAIAIRDLDSLLKKGDKFLDETTIRMPLRPSKLFEEANNFLGIRGGLNRKGSAAIVLMSPPGKERIGLQHLENLLVPVIPYVNADEMADNFGIAKGKLPLKTVHVTKGGMLRHNAMRTKDHFYLSSSSETLRRVLRSKSLADDLTPEQRKPFDASDIVIHLGRYFWEKEVAEVRLAEDLMRQNPDLRDDGYAKRLATAITEIRNAVLGFRIDDGLDAQLLATFPKGGAGEKLLASLRDQRQPSSLQGLPDGNVLFAQAASGDADEQAFLAKVMFHFLIDIALIDNRVIAPIDRLHYLGVLHEVWRQLKSNRLAVYQNADEPRHGLFSAVAILDTDDAPRFLRDLKALLKMGQADSLDWTKKETAEEIDIAKLVKQLESNIYKIRQSATTRLALIGERSVIHLQKAVDTKSLDLESTRRVEGLLVRIQNEAAERRKLLLDVKAKPLFPNPKLTYVANGEKRDGVSLDIIQVALPGAEKARTMKYAGLFGPDWDKLRIGVVGKQIIIMLGSDARLFDECMRNVTKGSPGLVAGKRLARFHEQANAGRLFELHVGLEGVMRLVTQNAGIGPPSELTSIALTLGPQSLHVQARMPASEIRVIARRVQGDNE
ncbi:MAG: hypothetical protein EXS16_15230 [Gemmataceae bacterium]|nr:hypothetical protein [Gemmataceae bacterium]